MTAINKFGPDQCFHFGHFRIRLHKLCDAIASVERPRARRYKGMHCRFAPCRLHHAVTRSLVPPQSSLELFLHRRAAARPSSPRFKVPRTLWLVYRPPRRAVATNRATPGCLATVSMAHPAISKLNTPS